VNVNNSTWCLMEQGASAQRHTTGAPGSSMAAARGNNSGGSVGTSVAGGSSSSGSSSGSSSSTRLARGGPMSRTAKVLSISLALPEPTVDEVVYKKGTWLRYTVV
jgi:hypothetical protein